MRFLDETGQSSKGLLEFFEKLGDQEALLTANQDPYVRTHPLTRERVAAVAAHVAHSPVSDNPEPQAMVLAHARMKAKLFAFLESPTLTYRHYPRDDTSLPARYAHAIAQHREHQFDAAVATTDGLIADYPKDPFFRELKGQILLEAGDPDAAVAPYAEAVRLRPDLMLLRLGLGQAQVSARSDEYLDDALENLQRAVQLAPRDPNAWRWLAQAYGRKGDVGNASLATAERYILQGRYRDAIGLAQRAERALPAGSPAQLRAQDIKNAAARAADIKLKSDGGKQ
jgi:predicted Zn-dependent protease